MSRPIGSENIKEVPVIVAADEAERLEYLACLLLSITEEELQESDGLCNQA